MIRDTRNLQTEYPKCKVIGNLDYKFQDDELKDWQQIIDYKNNKKGVIIQIDEIQNWFNSKASKDFPMEMTQIVTTNRKQRRVIMGTAQRFYMVAKDIRTQVTEVRNCTTLFGCLTMQRQVQRGTQMRNTPPDRGAAERTVLGSPWGVSFRPGRRHRPAPLCPADAHGHGLH